MKAQKAMNAPLPDDSKAIKLNPQYAVVHHNRAWRMAPKAISR
jgi:hypothetical protein